MRFNNLIQSIKIFLHPIVRKMRGCINIWPESKRTQGLMELYRLKMGYDFDLSNPVTFTEKVQWYKIYYDNGYLERVVDKAFFKDYIKETLGDGYTIPMYNVYSNIKELMADWDNLPEEFVLKSTVQSDGKFIEVIRKKSEVNTDELIAEVKEWFNPYNTLINSFCRAYYRAKPRVLAEQYMSQFKDQLYDYKFFCFDGLIECVYVAMDHFMEEDYPITFYDLDWNKLEVQYGKHKVGDAPKPKHWEEMKVLAQKLSQGFPFIRVDFFDTEDRLYIAELTFYPGGGMTPYYPVSFNHKLGDLFILPNNSTK